MIPWTTARTPYPRRSTTWDRGSEMAAYEQIRIDLGAPVYPCNRHSRSLVQKGHNQYTTHDLKRVQDSLNRRPRPTLNPDMPAQRPNQLILQSALTDTRRAARTP
jgi:transposase, IS30 family